MTMDGELVRRKTARVDESEPVTFARLGTNDGKITPIASPALPIYDGTVGITVRVVS